MKQKRILLILLAVVIGSSLIAGYTAQLIIGAPVKEVYLGGRPPAETATPRTMVTKTVTAATPTTVTKPSLEVSEKRPEAKVSYSGQPGRFIAYSGSVGISVPEGEVEAAAAHVTALVEGYDGYISSMEVTARKAVITAKIPAEHLSDFLDSLSTIGKIEERRVEGIDVTDKIIDLKARLRNAEAEESRLLELFERAGTVSELLEVERELARVREEIEVLNAQIKNLETRVTYSSITISIYERKEYVKLLFRVVDSRGVEVPGAEILVKPSSTRLITDELGEAEAFFEKGENLTIVVTYLRSDGHLLKRILEEYADRDKTVLIRFGESIEPPAVNLEWIGSAALAALGIMATGLLVIVIIVLPSLMIALALYSLAVRVYKKLRR